MLWNEYIIVTCGLNGTGRKRCPARVYRKEKKEIWCMNINTFDKMKNIK